MELNADRLHHAYILLGDLAESQKKLQAFFERSVLDMQWLSYAYEKLGIDEVRELREILSEKSDGRFIVISAERFPPEAQQAFLKMLEEPAPNTHIFILLPAQLSVLETIQSRAVVIRSDDLSQIKQLMPLKSFLLESVPARLDRIEDLVKSRGKDESLQAYEVQQFLDQLESALYALFSKKRSSQYSEYFEAIRDGRTWAGQTGFPMKNVIEYVAMVLPEFGKK
jgi:hypothetical protein